METVVIVIIGLLVTGIIIRQVTSSAKSGGCTGCELGGKDKTCSQCGAAKQPDSFTKKQSDGGLI